MVAVQQVDGRVHEEVPHEQEEQEEEQDQEELFFFNQPLQLLPPCGKVRLTSAARPSMHLPEGAAVDNASRAGEAGPGAGAGAVEGARRGARDEAQDGLGGSGQVQARNPAPVYAYYDTMHQTIKPLGSVHAPVIRVQGEREPRLTFWTAEQTMALLQGLNALDTEMKVKTQGRWQAVARLMAMQSPAFVTEAVRACHKARVVCCCARSSKSQQAVHAQGGLLPGSSRVGGLRKQPVVASVQMPYQTYTHHSTC